MTNLSWIGTRRAGRYSEIQAALRGDGRNRFPPAAGCGANGAAAEVPQFATLLLMIRNFSASQRVAEISRERDEECYRARLRSVSSSAWPHRVHVDDNGIRATKVVEDYTALTWESGEIKGGDAFAPASGPPNTVFGFIESMMPL